MLKKPLFLVLFVMFSSTAIAQAIVTDSTSNSTTNSFAKTETTVNNLRERQAQN